MNMPVTNRTTHSVVSAKGTPLLTAIVATSNAEAHIRECLQGLMNQTIAERMEVIVVDEASEQSEWAIIAEFQRRYGNITCIRTTTGLGNYAGWNMTAKIASGTYITVLDVTDRLRRDAYELLADTLEKNPEVMLTYGDTCFTAIPHETFDNHTSYGKMIWPDYTFQQLTQLSLIAPHLMWRKEVHGTVGYFNPQYTTQGMRDFLLRIVEDFKIMHINEFTGLRLVSADTSLTNGDSERELADIRLNYQGRQMVVNQLHGAAPPQAASQPQTQPLPQCQPQSSAEEAYQPIQAVINAGKSEGATKLLTDHLRTYPNHALAHNDLAVLYYQAGNKEDALFHYRMAAKFNPDNITFQKNLADFYFVEAGNSDEAIAIYLDVLKKFPRDIETLLNLGQISLSIDQPDEAQIFFKRALELEPWNSTARQQLTALQQPAATALPSTQAGSQAAPSGTSASPEESYQKVKALISAGDNQAALAALEKLVASFPDFALGHNDLAVLYYQNGAKEKALIHYEEAVRLEPQNPAFQKNLADYYFVEAGMIDDSIKIYLDLLQKHPRDIETLLNLGKISTVLNRPEEAKIFYGKAIQIEPWNATARESLLAIQNPQ